MNNKNKMTVEIFGETYALKGDMDVEYVKKLANMVDQQMRLIAKSNHRLPVAKIAVLAALNISNDYIKLEEDYKQMIDMFKDD
ncbi:cell division protein ZapA [Anaerosinus massiliensis]|uniref:cell division protein ZapA n=1 Tax=Massilibacillus massiliensis TaxID=1806837 RepID=UPI000DA600C2|nr:cell division protein ZapA [Massilibacillus massiliensis]